MIAADKKRRRRNARVCGRRVARQGKTAGEAKQPGGKLVHSWAVQDDWMIQPICAATCSKLAAQVRTARDVPEFDRAAWFDIWPPRRYRRSGNFSEPPDHPH
jgi:predicted NUDIX family NTP pyrophosphohydrolase